MALKINKTLEGEILASECYIKIIEAKYLRQQYPVVKEGTTITVGFYFNKVARDNDEFQFINSERYLIEDTTKETRKSQYEYLKTLDEFSEAVDI